MKLLKSKNSYVIAAASVLFVLMGVLAVQLINKRVNHFNQQTLRKLAHEKHMLMRKEMEAVNTNLSFLISYAQAQQTNTLNYTITKHTDYAFLAGYTYQAPNTPPISFFKGNNADSIAITKGLQQNKYFSRNNEVYTKWQMPCGKGNISFYIALKQLNTRFWDNELGGYAYSEIYDNKAYYIIGPEQNRIGKADASMLQRLKNNVDTVLISPYLNLEVLQRAYTFNDLLPGHQILVAVPLIITAGDVEEISYLIWLLWAIGALMLIFFLVFIIKQQNKQHVLQLNNIKYEREQSRAELGNLKQKLNPHFLFNTLGTLHQLIGKDATVAKTFVLKLASVYRGLLQAPATGVSTLKSELELLEEYLYLQQLRFGASLAPVIINVPANYTAYKLPTLGLQLLIENAIKHNEMSKENPLHIIITAGPDGLTVQNTTRPRSGTVPSDGYGTQILQKTYKYYGIAGYLVSNQQNTYTVKLPYLP